MAEISVADTGPGIIPEVADRLFEPFVTTKKTGMGLGLSICRDIVEAHHGRLTTAPSPEGGAVFRISLPILALRRTMPADRLVYIVDDDEAVRDSLSLLLEAQGCTVRTLFGAGISRRRADLRPGCLIADIRMPEMDGLEMQQQLIERALPFPLIVITGNGDVPLAVRAMKTGAVDFIEKPFAADTILNSVEIALARLAEASGPDPMAVADKRG